MRIIDTHLRLIYLDRFTYEWLDSVGINQQWDAPSYFAEAEGLGIEAALHMECGGKLGDTATIKAAFVDIQRKLYED